MTPIVIGMARIAIVLLLPALASGVGERGQAERELDHSSGDVRVLPDQVEDRIHTADRGRFVVAYCT